MLKLSVRLEVSTIEGIIEAMGQVVMAADALHVGFSVANSIKS